MSSDTIRLLYANDDADFAELVTTTLGSRLEDVETTHVESAAAGVDRLADDGPRIDCVVSAYTLADGDGLEFLDRVREHDGAVPFVLFTGRGSEELAAEAIGAGVSDYVPISGDGSHFDILARRIETLVEAERSRRRASRAEDRARRALERSSDAVYSVDDDWRITYWNEQMTERTDRAAEAVVGETLWDVFPDMAGTDLADRYRRAKETGEVVEFESYVESFDYWVEVRAFPDDDGLTVFSREITARKERQDRLEALGREYEAVFENVGDALFLVDVTDGGEFEYRRLNDAHEALTGLTTDAVKGKRPRDVLGDDLGTEVEARYRRCLEAGEPITYEEELDLPGGTRIWQTKLSPVFADGRITEIVGASRDVTERKRFEEQLRGLQVRTSELNLARTVADVGEIAVETAAEVLDFPVTGVWAYDEAEDVLCPLAQTEAATQAFGDMPRFDGGESLAWRAFENEAFHVYDDVSTVEGRYNPDTAMQAEIISPLGEHGVVVTGTTDEREFTDTEVDVFRIFAATVEAALARANREDELRRQNERLDEFASIVAHDLRNPIAAAQGWLEVVRDTGDPSRLDDVEASIDRMSRLVEDLLTLARGAEAVTDPEPVSLETVAREAWGYVDTADGALAIPDDPGVIDADRSRLTQLFENLFRNSLEHGGEDVTITVGATDEGFFVEDDGVGIPPDQREEVFDHGYTTAQDGTGFGLAIVEDIVEAHGWSIAVSEGGDGGARFEIAHHE
jgi:PAS domain S-box-containing protein